MLPIINNKEFFLSLTSQCLKFTVCHIQCFRVEANDDMCLALSISTQDIYIHIEIRNTVYCDLVLITFCQFKDRERNSAFLRGFMNPEVAINIL